MVAWEIKYHPKAEKDLRLLKAANLERKARKLLDVMALDPFGNPPPYEQLVQDLKGNYSRRLNRQHRIVYGVRPDDRVIIIYSMFHHYKDVGKRLRWQSS